MAIQADIYADCVQFIKDHKIKKLADIQNNVSVDEAYDFIRNLLWKFDSLDREDESEQE